MECSPDDYYAVLGLDPGASQESIKLAYRRLARESHPDRNFNSDEAEKNALSLRMAQLNGAYAVLSDPTRRREYDEQLKILSVLKTNTVSRTTGTVTVSKSVTVTKSVPRSNTGFRAQRSHDSDSILMRDLSTQLRSNLLANRNGFSFKEITLEGFDWGLECVSWATHYCLAGRGFGLLDPPAAKKFTTYSERVITQFSRPVRKSHFLFLLPFQHVSQWDSVSAEFNRLFSPGNRGTMLDVPIGIVLFDSQRGRTLRIGGRLKEKNFEEMLKCVGPALMNSGQKPPH